MMDCWVSIVCTTRTLRFRSLLLTLCEVHIQQQLAAGEQLQKAITFSVLLVPALLTSCCHTYFTGPSAFVPRLECLGSSSLIIGAWPDGPSITASPKPSSR